MIPNHEFYSYEAKYLDKEGANYKTPVDLPADITQRVQRLAIDAYRVLCCEGMARVDFFLKESGDLIVTWHLGVATGFNYGSLRACELLHPCKRGSLGSECRV